MQLKITVIFSLLFLHSLYAEENCVNCPSRKVEGMPTPANIATIASAVNKSTTKDEDFDHKVRVWCMKYNNMPPQDTLFLAKEIEASGYSFADVLKNPVCDPSQIGGNNRITMLQHSVEKPIDRFQSLETMYKYCVKKLKNEQIFVDAINALNTAGMSLLDYTIWVENQNGPHMTETLNRIRNFVCSKGGVYVKYKDKKCN
ncbi:MAG: hypothetical protein Fur0010_23600 [Bdellovibrio sp.]